MKKYRLSVLCLTITLAAVLLSGCGNGGLKNSNIFGGGEGGDSSEEGGSDQTQDASHYFKAEYLENMPASFNNLGKVAFSNDLVIYRASNEDYTKAGIYSYNLSTGEQVTLFEQEESNSGPHDPTEPQGSFDLFSVDDGGNLYYLYHTYQTDPAINDEDFSQTTEADLVNWMVTSWSFTADEAEKWLKEEYYARYKNDDGTPDFAGIMKNFKSADYPSIEHDYLIKCDLSGNEVFRTELDQLRVEAQSEGGLEGEDAYYGGSYVMALECDKGGNAYLLYDRYDNEGDKYIIEVFDGTGAKKSSYTQDEYIDGFCKLYDGSIAVRIDNYDENTRALYAVGEDGRVDKTGTPAFTAKTFFTGGVAISDSQLLYNDGNGIMLLENGGEKGELYLKWLDCDVSPSSVNGFSILSDGRIAVYAQHYGLRRTTSELILLTEVDKSEIKEKTILKLATIYIDSDMEDRIVDFNRKSNDYHVDVLSFVMPEGDDIDYDTECSRFMLSLITDDSIDIIALNGTGAYNKIMNFAQKDLLIDLGTVMDSDPDISADMFIDNVVAPFYYDDKLVALPSDFHVMSLIGKTEDVGAKSGWTAADVEALLSQKPDNTKLTMYNTREQMLGYVMCTNYSTLVNTQTGECHFDSQEFKDALMFASHFPDEIDWEHLWDTHSSETEMFRSGELLLSEYIVNDIKDLQLRRAVFGGDITFIGYPATQGNGALLSYNYIYGITTHCEDASAAWQLLRFAFLPREADLYYSDMPIRKDDFEKYLADAKTLSEDEAVTDYSWDDISVKIQAPSDADIQMVRELVYGTTAVEGAVPDGVMSIVKEEASAYFSGQKSIDEIAGNVQSRVKVYLSETR